ncbi:MAG TPA: peptidoglycan bridge formation glycyltransferase FemA/FemB family protein, partial [Allocoleopsis sp.]
QEKGVCSAFLRLHPLLNNGFNQVYQEDGCKFLGETIGIDLRLSEAELWQQTRPQYRRTINHCNRMGLKARICSPQNYLREFTSLYQETMNRVHAAENYYFKEEYFHNLIEGLGEKLHLCIVEFENKIISAGLLTEYNGIVQSHLRGTKTEFMKYSPSKLMFNFIRTWAKQRGNEILHLGGGVGSCKDSLYQFKAGFSKQRYPFLTLQLIIDKTKYAEMVESHAKYLGINSSELLQANYFPAYRACS